MKYLTFAGILISLLLVVSCSGPESGTKHPEQVSQAAGTLQETLDAPGHVEETFISASGVSTVKVDADVYVPEASGANLIEVTPRAFTKKDISRMIRRHGKALTWKYRTSSELYQGEGPEKSTDPFEKFDSYDLWISAGEDTDAAEERELVVSYDLDPDTGAPVSDPVMYYGQGSWNLQFPDIVPLTDGKAADCSITAEEATSLAEEEVSALASGYALAEYGQLPVYEAWGNPQYYVLRFTRSIGDIPVNPSVPEQAGPDEDCRGTSEIDVVVRDDGVCGVNYYNPEKLKSVTKKKVYLLSFSEIWDIFSQIAPLSLQKMESEKDLEVNRLSISEIRFGYRKLLQPDGTYLYTPVWDFYGTRFLAGTGGYAGGWDTGETPKDVKLTINAMDGTVIDREHGY